MDFLIIVFHPLKTLLFPYKLTYNSSGIHLFQETQHTLASFIGTNKLANQQSYPQFLQLQISQILTLMLVQKPMLAGLLTVLISILLFQSMMWIHSTLKYGLVHLPLRMSLLMGVLDIHRLTAITIITSYLLVLLQPLILPKQLVVLRFQLAVLVQLTTLSPILLRMQIL